MSHFDPPESGKTKLAPNWTETGRLAMRHEGENWNAYYALPNTMEGAVWLGSIKMAFVENRQRRRQFLDLMRNCMSDILGEIHGGRPHWKGEIPAPEHERSKE